jgi:hypothetical protein
MPGKSEGNSTRRSLMPRLTRRIGLLTLSVWLLNGCVGTVTRPDVETIKQPRPVYLVDHGRHTSLVLTREDESMVRYLYGEWRWYALQEAGPLRLIPTAFIPTQATLGRRELSGPPTESSIRRQVPVVIRKVHELPAEADLIDRMDHRLDLRFNAAIETLHYNVDYDLEFVHDPVDYTIFYNSNHVIADWLRELGIEVGGNPVWATWRILNED